MSKILLAAIEEVLEAESPGYISAAAVSSRLLEGGIPRLPVARLERLLEGNSLRFEMAHGSPAMWRLRDRPISHGSNAPPLYQWQVEAIEAWEHQDFCGIVEAVTGTGKSRVGVEAIRRSVEAGGKAHVLVPTIELQNQWCDVIQNGVPTLRIGRRGNGGQARFNRKDVIVSVVNSVRDFDPDSVPQHSLLIADEVHRYGSTQNSRALHDAFPRRLGLTATLEREDDGVDAKIRPYFGDVVFRIGFKRAIEDEVVANFRLALIGVDFASEDERQQYTALEEECSEARRRLIRHYGVPKEPFGEFMRVVAHMSGNRREEDGAFYDFEAVSCARRFLKAFTGKRSLLANTGSKHEALAELASIVKKAKGTLVFTETKDGAEEAAWHLELADVRAAAIHSGHDVGTRRDTLEDLRSGELEAVCAPRILDEGIDVPDSDLGIILAATKQRRQMIQRMGRVLRKKSDGRHARFVIVYVKGTCEDPDLGAHETFLDEITSVASRQRVFAQNTTVQSIKRFLG